MFRLDRFLTLYFFDPLLKRRRRKSELIIPILMYHSISDLSENAVHPYYRLNTSPGRFTQQIKYLSDNNYRAISLIEAVNLIDQSNNHLPSQPPNHSIDHKINHSTKQTVKYVILTFDDGYHDFLLNAWPILNKYNQTATVFLPTAYIGKDRKSFNGRNCLTWAEVRELQDNQVSFGSHTVSHASLYGLPWKQVQEELLGSLMKLEDELQKPVRTFSYPFAFPQEDRSFVQRFKEELSNQGYKTAVTTVIGRAKKGSDPLRLKRLPVNEGDDQRLFEAKLDGAYDWFSGAQKSLRLSKRLISSAYKH